jgi:hypothetical protein
MPQASDVRSTSHEGHDPLLVAALAAGDLAGPDRDRAVSLTRSCAECASLHDDLVSIARATAGVAPPMAMPVRDFRLTPADARRLRPAGWRRLLHSFASPRRRAVVRPLGIGLATLGLFGLLVGNIQLGAAGAAPASSSGAAGAGTAEQAPVDALHDQGAVASAAPAVEGSADYGAAASAAASGPARSAIAAAPVPASSASRNAVTSQGSSEATRGQPETIQPLIVETPGGSPATSMSVLQVASIAAIVLGLGLLVLSARRGRLSA